MLFRVENGIFLWICLFWPTSSKTDVLFFLTRYLAESVVTSRGTVGFHGTPVEKPWFEVL
jgi:hypothetical protein